MMAEQTEKPSLFRTAIQRLSFRLRKKKKSPVIEQSQRVDTPASAGRETKEEIMINYNTSELLVDKIQAVTPINPLQTCPPTPSERWRQKPPPSNSYLDAEWEKLRSSMNTVRHSTRNVVEEATHIDITNDYPAVSNLSLNTEKKKEELGAEKLQPKVTRAQSMSVLNGMEKIKVPSNQLMQMNQYQRRVQVSMERLSVPSWYNPPATPSSSSTTSPLTHRWRQAQGGSPATGWRRHIYHSSSPSTTSTLERNSTPLSSQRYRSRFGTLSPPTRSPSYSSIHSFSSSISSTPIKPVYLGWRSQESLSTVPAYLTSPAQRLASTVRLNSTHTTQAAAAGTEDFKADIMDITEAILDLCNGPSVDKEAWHVDDENDNTSDDMDEDSGIDRSEDFTHELLNEIEDTSTIKIMELTKQ